MKKKAYLLVILSLLLQGFIMPKTSPLIVLTVGDAELDTATSSDKHARADISNLVDGDAQRSLNYITYEPNGWLLDGKAHFAPTTSSGIGFVSDEISLADKSFASDPVLTLTLDSVVDIEEGITLEFSKVTGDYCTSVKVDYQDASSVSVYSKTYSPDSYMYLAEIESASQPAEDIKYIVITFYETNTAYRHVKLLDVYVDGVVWDKSNIRSAKIVEQINPVSVTSPSDTFDFSIYDPSGDFSVVDPQGVYKKLAQGQQLDVHENVGLNRLYMGRFYLKPNGWKSQSEKIADFECVDALKMLEGEEYMGDLWLKITGDDASDVIGDIMNGSDYSYSIDASLSSVPVYGWIPITNRRIALQQLAIAVGGYVTCSRSNKVEIRPLETADDVTSWDFTLDNSDTVNSKVDSRTPVTGIKIIAHTFTDQNPVVGEPVIFDENVEAGTLRVYAPGNGVDVLGIVAVDLSSGKTTATTASSISFKDNYAEFEVTGAGRLVLIDYKVNIHNRTEFNLTVPNLPAGTKENIIVIENATLVNPDNVAEIALRLLTYYQQRYAMKTKLFASEIAVGDSAKIDTQSSKKLTGITERMEIDLAGGFTQQLRVVGGIYPHSLDWIPAEYLLLGGGGSGAASTSAGGGGAGEMLCGIELLVPNTTYTVTIGQGGAGVVNGAGNSGTNTTLTDGTYTSLAAHGGGHGGKGSTSSTAAQDGADGGNGGGGGGNTAGGTDGRGGAGYRHKGGGGSNGASNYGGGGGGGNNETGVCGATACGTNPGKGGDGKANDITGTSIVYGGGGGGIGSVDTGLGGDGGGGNGNRSGNGVSGTDGLGGGGGAGKAGYKGGDGGNGLAILRIKTALYSGVTTGSPTVTTDGDYTVVKWTSNGSYTA